MPSRIGVEKEALISYFLRREERSKYLSFSWRKKRTKRTSTLPKAPPYMEGMQPESRRNRRLSVGFGIAGHAMSFLSAAQRRGRRDEFFIGFFVFAAPKFASLKEISYICSRKR
jgi:hypothetical protein